MVAVYDPKKLNKRLFLSMRQREAEVDIILVDANGQPERGGLIGTFKADVGFMVSPGIKIELLRAAGFIDTGIDCLGELQTRIRILGYRREY